MNNTCQACGGAVFPKNIAYAYAGKVCSCQTLYSWTEEDKERFRKVLLEMFPKESDNKHE